MKRTTISLLLIITCVFAFMPPDPSITSCKQKHLGFLEPYIMNGIIGHSMEPTTFENDTAFMKKVRKPNALAENDIIVFFDGEIWVMHRIIEIRNGAFKTKGDNNTHGDSIIPNEDDVRAGEVSKVFMLTRNNKAVYCA